MAEQSIGEYIKEMAESVDGEITKYLTDKGSARYLETLLGRSGYQYDRRAIERAVLEPSRYLFGLGGKRIRSVLMLTVIAALGKDPEEYKEFSMIPEVIHNGTLIHDDIEDGSTMRRGSEAVHIKYGLDIALNLGDFMFYFPIIALLDSKKLGKEEKTKILEIYQREMLRLSIGQATDIAWHRNNIITPDSISESQYLEMAYLKTGVLSGMSTKIGAALCGASDKQIEALGKFGATIGVAFQLQDDLLNLQKGKLAESKGGSGEDITEGKITLLVIKTFELADEKDKAKLKAILAKHSNKREDIDGAIAIINKYGAEDYIKELEVRLMDEAWNNVDKLIGESAAKKRLKEMADFLIQRTI